MQHGGKKPHEVATKLAKSSGIIPRVGVPVPPALACTVRMRSSVFQDEKDGVFRACDFCHRALASAYRGRGGTGRHTGLKILRPKGRPGSTPGVRTTSLLKFAAPVQGVGKKPQAYQFCFWLQQLGSFLKKVVSWCRGPLGGRSRHSYFSSSSCYAVGKPDVGCGPGCSEHSARP